MPQELENVLPGYEAWPSGYTIGPIERLKELPTSERITYIIKLLPQFQKLRWITNGSLLLYEQSLKRSDLNGVHRRLNQDLKAGNITPEVFSILQAMI
jgi:hypothetical protein